MKKTIFAIAAASLMLLVVFSAMPASADDPRGTIKGDITSVSYRPDGASSSVEVNGIAVTVNAIQNDKVVASTVVTAPTSALNPFDGFTLGNLYQGHTYKIEAKISSYVSPIDGKTYEFYGSTTVSTKASSLNPNPVTKCSISLKGSLKKSGGKAYSPIQAFLLKILERFNSQPMLKTILNRVILAL